MVTHSTRSRPKSKNSGLDAEPKAFWPHRKPMPVLECLDSNSDIFPELSYGSSPSNPLSPLSKRSVSPDLPGEIEGNSIDSIVWPKRRKHCAWMAGKVSFVKEHEKSTAARGKRKEVDSSVFRDEIVGYGVHPPTASSSRKECRGKHGQRRTRSSKTRNGRTTSASPQDTTLVDTKPKANRKPLRDITNSLDKDGNANETPSTSPSFVPRRTIPESWHRAIRSLLTQGREMPFPFGEALIMDTSQIQE
ncbi:hypothetical protein ACEPAI_1995 [Sanghuangporus weigelae]